MKYIQVVFLSILILFFGCETVLDIDIPVEPPLLVINSTLIDGEFIKVNVSKSKHILDADEFEKVTGATVEIYESGNLLTTLPDSLDGNYVSAIYKAQRGKTYELKVIKSGFETATAKVLLPLDTAIINGIEIDYFQENEFGYIASYLRFSVEIDDDIAFENYYDISIYQSGYYYEYDYSVEPPLFIDSVYYVNKINLESKDPSLEEFQSYGQNILFNDELFNGTKYNMNVYTYFNPEYESIDDYNYYVVLGNTSESYYLYGFTSDLQYWTSDNPFAQPVTVYNNIENGLGIFGAYNTAIVKVE